MNWFETDPYAWTLDDIRDVTDGFDLPESEASH